MQENISNDISQISELKIKSPRQARRTEPHDDLPKK